MNLHKHVLLCLAFTALPLCVFGDEFVFKYTVGDKFRIISEINEQYFKNSVLLNTSNIHNRISTEVTGFENGKAFHKGLFQVMVDKTAADGSKSLNITNEYTSQFQRDALGKMQVSRIYAFPSVRNVPVFPKESIKTGDTWFENGEEVHDMQGNFGMKDLLRIPFNAKYKYLGEQTWRGKKYPAFLVTYKIRQNLDDYFEKNPRRYITQNNTKSDVNKEIVITSITGETDQTIFWDTKLGQPAASRGTFSLRFNMSDGTVHEFRSKEEAEIIYSEEMNRDVIAGEVEKKLRDSGINGATVKKVEGGVSISIDNIQFEGDSAFLRASEKQKLDKIAAVLERYASRDILVAGHTADAGGTQESHIKLSESRAAAVAGYLVQKKVRPAGRIMTKGYGTSAPIAGNDTPEGRAQNRRVEIILLEN
ncbi:MAG: OmpA family protein [Spirochaetaceae bacterium]|jgi:outer membrane protein OmpA-like peptidoglycan-associated protein|nr:OmpA family protein [Spirochaetaceae bacterium]